MEEEWDAAFARRDAERKAGRPVQIAVTERLLIRETTLSDVPALYRILRKPEVGRFLDSPQPSLGEELAFMEAYIRHAYSFYDFGLWSIVERVSGQVVGRAGLFPTGLPMEGVELGYVIDPSRQRRGYALECGRAIVRYAFETLDIPELHLLTDRRNTASVRTAEALCFVWRETLCMDGAEMLHYTRENGEQGL